MLDILSKVQVHMPFHLLPQYQETILHQKLNLEIYFSHYALQNMDKSNCIETAKVLVDCKFKDNFSCPLYGFTSRSTG